MCATLLKCPMGIAQPVHVEVGLRIESMTLDDDIEFETLATTDSQSHPDCTRMPNRCGAARLAARSASIMGGFTVGLYTTDRYVVSGLRLASTFGVFEPPEPELRDAVLAHVTLELPVEVHLTWGATQGYVQLAPRIGWLSHQGQGYELAAHAWTAGLMFVAGMRFGGGFGMVGAACSRIAHSSFGGWAVDGAYGLRLGNSALFPQRPLSP